MWKRSNKNKVLVLNADYMPLCITDWKMAMTALYVKDTLVPIKYYEKSAVSSSGREYPVPAVMVSKKYVKRDYSKVPFSRRNVFIRDKLTCQYCGKKCQWDNAEMEHVIPRAQWKRKWGSPTTFANTVTACRPCNQKKADKTPEQAGMKLRFGKPDKPLYIDILLGTPYEMAKIPEEWHEYLEYLKKGRR